MELEQMKAIWSDMSTRLDRQQKVTDHLILKMAHEKSSSRLSRIIAAESVGIVFTGVLLILLISRFDQLDNWLTTTGGIVTALIFLISILMGGRIIQQARKINLATHTYQQNLANFTSLKKTLGFYKRLNIIINILMPFFLLPVVFKLFLGKDLLQDFASYGWSLLLAGLITPVALYLIIRYYRRNMSQVSKAIRETESRN